MKMFKKQPGVFRMSAQDGEAEILIYDVIGEDWYGGVTSKDFITQLAGLGDVESIAVRINSPGGDVFEGVAIYNALKMHPAKITVQVDSLAASIATVIAMAGDTITISDSGMMMVHNASGICFGEARDMRQMADLLDKIRAGMMLGAYARTGKTVAELTDIMDAETWYTAQEAVDAGWADAIATVPAKKAEARAKFDLSAYKHAPKAMQADGAGPAMEPEKEPQTPVLDGKKTGKAPENGLISAELQQESLIVAQLQQENLRLVSLL